VDKEIVMEHPFVALLLADMLLERPSEIRDREHLRAYRESRHASRPATPRSRVARLRTFLRPALAGDADLVPCPC
jgi:hypothetical protein